MPSSITSGVIVSQAFRELEKSPISSFGDDSEEARAAAEMYPIALGRCLEHADWRFASTLVLLPAAVLDPIETTFDAYPNVFAKPADLVAIRDFPDVSVDWTTTDRYIHASITGPLKLRYTRLITNEARLPASFQKAVAVALAVDLSPRWMATRTKRAELEAKEERALLRAARYDARQSAAHRWDGQPDQGDWAREASA